MYAKVIVEIGVKAVDRLFTYLVPSRIVDKIKVGARVKVPFGRQLLEGFVLELSSVCEDNYEIKEIIELVDEEPILNEEMLWLGGEISKRTLCSKISAYQVMLPKALRASYNTDIKKKYVKYLVLNISKEDVLKYIDKCRYEGQVILLRKLLELGQMKVNKVDSSIRTLEKKGIVKLEERIHYRYEVRGDIEKNRVTLNDEQLNVVNRVLKVENTYQGFLLYGVTGAGKTEVYMNIIEGIIKRGKTAIMLVPEISLTPQIVKRFVSRFGTRVAILHSGLSDGEKYDEYRKIMEGKVDIVVGARSAIFAPLNNLGVIIIDEEHSTTYKQDNHPRYHARDVAILRAKYHKCPLVLGSATPSLESMARAGKNVYQLLTLKKRAGKGNLPSVHIVDMKEEVKRGRYIFSKLLDDKIQEKLNKNEQIILL